MDQDKNYTLEQLQLWIEESLESEATPEEIYNCIRSTISSKVAHHDIYLKHSKELLSLLSGNNRLKMIKRINKYKVGKDMDIL